MLRRHVQIAKLRVPEPTKAAPTKFGAKCLPVGIGLGNLEQEACANEAVGTKGRGSQDYPDPVTLGALIGKEATRRDGPSVGVLSEEFPGDR